ncbi:FtsX-like permease family protein [Bifidobacterium stellenboschense]|uniref:Efflux ABC transporter permease n=1 Tax=Bifidobacterium stellenboschense TaxID=762211 RepID=A0A087DGC1_9BIFI|nr:FtsX-like permease family protein [Bifidobacterium stellenboschense]KFI94571.1 efflux ABC transporter permease [Bifidobacterium stellenboschense]
MFRITVNLMRATARMLIPAGIAVLIGTAFIASTFLFGNAMNDSLIRQQTAIYAGADAMVLTDLPEHPTDRQSDEAYSRTVADYHLDRMRAVEGVEGARAVTSATIGLSHGTRHATGYAINTGETSLLPVTVTHGERPIDGHGIALPEHVAGQLGLHVGDTVRVTPRSNTGGGGTDSGDTGGNRNITAGVEARVTGLTDDPNGAYAYDGGASILSDDLMAYVNGVADFDQVNATSVYLDLDAHADTAAIRRLLPRYSRLVDRDEANRLAVESLSANGTSVVTTFLMSFGVLALLVAALVIANTFQVLVAQRRRILALLRAIGADRRQLYASVLCEAGILGLIASLLGVMLGIGLMALLCATGVMKTTGAPMRLIVTWPVIAVPVAFGLFMTVIASLGPAHAATSVTPLEALRPIELTETAHRGRARAVLSAIMLVVGIALCAFGTWQTRLSATGHASLVDDHYPAVLLATMGGCALTFIALIISAVHWMPALMRGAGALAAATGPSAAIAHANIQKNPRRIASTGAALLIGITLVSAIATGAASAKTTMADALATRYSVDMIATGTGMTEEQSRQVRHVKGVGRVLDAPTALRHVTDDQGHGLDVLIVGVPGVDSLAKVMHADLTGVTLSDRDILMPRQDFGGAGIDFGRTHTADLTATDVAAGNDVTNPAATAGVSGLDLTVVQADYRRVSSVYDAVAFVTASHFADGDLPEQGRILLMTADPDANPNGVAGIIDGVREALNATPDANVTGPIAERNMWDTSIDAMMALLVGLIAVAVLIALIGVANTLSLSVIERTRESATLRAIGMTRGQLRRSLAVEALLLSLVSGVAGVTIGTLFGWLGSYMVFSLYGTVAMPFAWKTNGAVLAVSALAALLASLLPARRAANTPPVEALAEA